MKSPTGGSIHSRQSVGGAGNPSKSPIDDVLSGELFSPSSTNNNKKPEHDFSNLFGGPAMNMEGLFLSCSYYTFFWKWMKGIQLKFYCIEYGKFVF